MNSMNVENLRSNYQEDRSSNFKHHIPEDIAPLSAPTVQDYVHAEKAKQMSKMRDWYLEAKAGQTDISSLRSSFANLRAHSEPSPQTELNRHKGYLLTGAFLAATIGGLLLFVHF